MHLLAQFLFRGSRIHLPVSALSGGERLLATLVCVLYAEPAPQLLLLDEPTNNLDPRSREEVLRALASYTGSVVLVTHDEGAVEALKPERVILLPDGVEDRWSDDLADLVALA
jgi:ATPase subunit of ABC transporter with duplicated ATPase domains